jgi:hypothetical protein
LAFLVPVIVLVWAASAMAAEPPSPKLVMTDPDSSSTEPAASLAPAVLGEAEPEDGIIRESAPASGWPLLFSTTSAVLKSTENPNFEIRIFNNATCAAPAIKTGTAGELEGLGITVNVEADVKTTLTALQVDPGDTAHPSACSNPLYYWEGNVPPEEGSSGGGPNGGGGDSAESGSGGGGGSSSDSAGFSSGGSSSGGAVSGGSPAGGKPDAPRIHLSPSGRANDRTPLIVGSASGADNVSIYANANCGGAPVAKAPASQLPSGIQVTVPRDTATTFTAVAIGAERSACSAPVTYTEDSTAPHTRITMGPGVKTRRHKAVFRFADVTEDPPGTTFRCKVNKRKWKPCSSPFRLKHLKPRRYLLRIRATDLAGNVEPRPVERRFKVVSASRR